MQCGENVCKNIAWYRTGVYICQKPLFVNLCCCIIKFFLETERSNQKILNNDIQLQDQI